MYVRYRNFNSSNSSCIMASVIALDNTTHEAEYRTRWYNLTAGQPRVSAGRRSERAGGLPNRHQRAGAPVFGTTSASPSPPCKICSWPAAAGEPASTRVVHSTWRRSIVRTASVARSSPGAKETRGATYNGGYCLPSGGSPTRPMIPAAAASLLRRTPDHGYVTAETLPAHYFPDSSTVMWDDRL
ncbi:hypothetical protein HPB50_010574 [Hyalomma asiaticum]|uniref:Uncharacterized protein n=1 Tax=Hyalomma asiaticum TaxID=266040 RepID=A0ACB7SX35_HYAAI|nr:hypothetical protein HPB50_010574 [Hyalomma asiaticum]